MRTKFMTRLLIITAAILGGSALAFAAAPALRMDSIGIIQARGFSEVDAGINVQNGDLNVVGKGPITVLPTCTLSAGTTCTMADTTATALSHLVCGPVSGSVDGGAVTAASVTEAMLNQGTGWTLTVSVSTTGQIECIRIN